MYRQVIVSRLLVLGSVVGCLFIVRLISISSMLLQIICLVVVMNGFGRFRLCVYIELNVQLIGVISSNISLVGELVRLLLVLSQIILRKLMVIFSYLLWLVCCLCSVENSVIYSGIEVIVVVVRFEDILCLVSIIMLLFSISMVMFIIIRLCYCCSVGFGSFQNRCSVRNIRLLVMMKWLLEIIVSGSVLLCRVLVMFRQVEFQIMQISSSVSVIRLFWGVVVDEEGGVDMIYQGVGGRWILGCFEYGLGFYMVVCCYLFMYFVLVCYFVLMVDVVLRGLFGCVVLRLDVVFFVYGCVVLRIFIQMSIMF